MEPNVAELSAKVGAGYGDFSLAALTTSLKDEIENSNKENFDPDKASVHEQKADSSVTVASQVEKTPDSNPSPSMV